MEEKLFDGMKYLISYPEDFKEDKTYPLLVFLHGAGMRSPETTLLRENPSLHNIMNRQTQRGYLLLAPLCSVKNWNEVMETLIRLVDTIRNLPYVDITRVYLTGNSMGGYGTWELASLRPDWFAAIMPVCGGGIKWMAVNLVDMPIRAFHGICDPIVDPSESLEMVKAVNRRGGHAQLILFPNLQHNCWDATYSNEANYDWLMSFTTHRDKTLVEQYSGAYYG